MRMKKRFIALLAAGALAFSALPTMAQETASFSFEGEELGVVTNTLEDGGEAQVSDGVLTLDGTYGLYLGEVTNKFAVSALVKVTSEGDSDTLFFKNMGTKDYQKWTGVLSKSGKAAFWSHGSDARNKTVVFESSEANLTEWRHVVYTENAGVGRLYINGLLQGYGNVANGAGDLYLGVTYWEDDAIEAEVRDVKVFDTNLSYEDVFNMYYDNYASDTPRVPDIASEAVEDIELIDTFGIKSVTWETSDESVITTTGKVTRGDEDKTVVLKAYMDGELTNEFTVTVPKKAEIVNEDVLLSYVFDENDTTGVIHDASGNGNHATAYNGLEMTENGAYFDGLDDYVKMPDGILNGHDEITIVFKTTPERQEQHIFAYAFGNSSSEGYIFLNTSRPSTTELRLAATPEGSGSEQAVYYAPGVNIGESAEIVVVLNGTEAALYRDGELLMEGDLGMTVSDLGDTVENYIGKSLYSSDAYYKGLVSEFTVYDKAMTADEVRELYAK